MTMYLCGSGTAVPRFGISQADAAEIANGFSGRPEEQQRLVPTLYRRTGVRQRHSVILDTDSGPLENRQTFFQPGENSEGRGPTTAARMDRYQREAGVLGAAAARRALADARTAAGAITHLITVSCSGFSAPGFDIMLIDELSLPRDTARTHIGFMGCHGALNALRVARSFTRADPQACVLICCVELCSLHHQYGWDPQQIVANALFADGAAALVCQGRPPEGKSVPRLEDNGSTIVPDTNDAMTWRIRDHGFQMSLSPQVPDLIHRHLRPWIEGWLAGNHLNLKQVRSWAIHPGGPRILSACGESLEFGREHLADSLEVLANYGNMSSPTVIFILDRLRQRNAESPCVMLGFGPGLAIEAALVKW